MEYWFSTARTWAISLLISGMVPVHVAISLDSSWVQPLEIDAA